MLERHPEEVKLVHKNFPLAKHKLAKKAAAAALSADVQGRFWEFHERLFENYQDLDDAILQAIATELNLDMERFERDMKDPAIQKIIIRDMREGQKAGVRGIPALFINGKRMKNRSLETMEAKIQAELGRK